LRCAIPFRPVLKEQTRTMLTRFDKIFLVCALVFAAPGALWAQADTQGATSVESELAPGLAASLAADTALQDATIIAVRRALGARDLTSAVRRVRFVDAIRFHIETYRSIHDANVLATIQNRYSEARGELLEARLPESIAELVQVLESL